MGRCHSVFDKSFVGWACVCACTSAAACASATDVNVSAGACTSEAAEGACRRLVGEGREVPPRVSERVRELISETCSFTGRPHRCTHTCMGNWVLSFRGRGEACLQCGIVHA